MRQPNPELHADRRRTILNASVRAFARAGFHKATMPEIALEAGMSPANLYRYFASKEILVAALVEEDRAAAKAEIGGLLAGGDPIRAMLSLMSAHLAADASESALALEIFAQSLRDAALGRQVREADDDIHATLADALRAAAADGRLAPEIDPQAAAAVLLALIDGLTWRRAVDPAFDAARVDVELRRLLAVYLTPP